LDATKRLLALLIVLLKLLLDLRNLSRCVQISLDVVSLGPPDMACSRFGFVAWKAS
jgi:hypothetical protein